MADDFRSVFAPYDRGGPFHNWVLDTLAREDVIDLYFILTDLVEVNITEAEKCETAFYDAMAANAAGEITPQQIADAIGVPLGKLVL